MTTDDTRPLLPKCELRPMFYVEQDECITHNRLPWECREEMALALARHAALVAAAQNQHRRVENVTQDGDDWTGCLCGEADDDCAVLAALDGKPPETCCYARAAGLTCAYHAALRAALAEEPS